MERGFGKDSNGEGRGEENYKIEITHYKWKAAVPAALQDVSREFRWRLIRNEGGKWMGFGYALLFDSGTETRNFES
jgi:hypothetical protein